ncbi:MAG: Gldg family protein [Verrucomicrobia bacterium]|nr:Gldg family protein [Verrucomicrobiota bacterium]
MSDSLPSPAERAARPVNRWGLGTLSVLHITLVAVTLIALNYLTARHFTRIDLSRDGNYTLSPASSRYLASAALSGRSKPVRWIMAFRRSTPFYERVRVLAEEYARLSHGKIQLEVIDALRSPDRTQQVMAAYELHLVRDLIIIDARTDEGAAVTTNPAGTHELNPRVRLVVADDMMIHTTDQQGQRRPSGFQGEDVLTAGLVQAVEGRPRKMLFLADKSKIDAEGENSPWQALENTLRFQNIELQGVNLSGLEEIPADAEGVALVAPKYDLADGELAVLERYWSRPRAALLVLLEPGTTLPKLRAFLRSNGVTPQHDRIIAKGKDRILTAARGTFTYNVDFIKDLAGQTSVFEGSSSSLEVRENADDLMTRKIYPTPLFQVADGFWGETKFGDGHEAYNPSDDRAAPLFLAAAVTRGAASDDKLAAETSRMIVIANTDFLKPENRWAENLDFLASAVNWLVGRESLAGIGPRSLGTYKLPILEAQVSFINRVNLFFLPAFLGVIGVIIWSSRRA